MARLSLAAILAHQRRIDLTRALIVDVDAQVHDTVPDRLGEVGRTLTFLAMSCHTVEAWDLLVDLHRLLQWVTDSTDDANLALLSDAVGCCALLASGCADEAVDLALSVHHRAADVDHPTAGYISTAPLIITALRAGRPEDGIRWVDRCVAMHGRLGTGAIGMFIETKANFMAQLGDFPQAARIYGVAHAATRRGAIGWPNRELSRPLLALTRERLSQADYERAWQEGERLTHAEIFGAPAPRSDAEPIDQPPPPPGSPGSRPTPASAPGGTAVDRPG